MHHDRPVYGATPWQAVRLFWTRYGVFSGRASRSEFWWWALVFVAVSAILEVVRFVLLGGDVSAWVASSTLGGAGLPGTVWTLVTLVPSLAQTARRLHDTNRSGWWQAVGLVPVVGWVLLIVWCASGPDPRGARYDRVPATPSG